MTAEGTCSQEETTPPASGFAGERATAGWMQDVVPFGIFTTDRELRVTSWNDWLVGHSGLAMSEVIGRRLTDIFPDLAARRIPEKYTRALAGEISVLSAALHKYLLPFRVTVSESGLPHMLQTARIAPLPEAGGIAGTITIIEDVTQREFQAGILNRQHELDRLLSTALATLLQSEDPVQEMSGIFGTVRLALGLDSFVSYLLAPDEKHLHLNAAIGIAPKQREAISLLALSAEDLTALGESSPLPPLHIASHVEALRTTGLRGLCSLPLAVGDRILGLVVFGSYQRETIATAEVNVLARIARYVSIALDRARREHETVAASHAKDDFLAALSHELRTPLNPVLLVASDAMENPEYPEEARDAFRIIEKNALLEARLIDDLLDLTRIAHGKLSVDLQPLGVHAALRDALSAVRTEIDESRVTLQVDFDSAEFTVLADSGRLQQVFWNVLKNAVKFTPRGGRIFVTSLADPGKREVALKISDTGIGMEPLELARIFGAFSQGDHAEHGLPRRFGGLGLGLAISRKLVELHGGRIEAASGGKGQGSTFTIFLPLAPAELPAAPPESAAQTQGSRAPHGRVTRILLVEDHEPTRAALTQLLARRGYEIVSAPSVRTALDEAAVGSFDLVLSDIGLPDGDGFSLMRKLRDGYGLRGIALTGYGMEEDLARSEEAGFFTHLTKPISVKVLDRALDKAFPAARA